MTLKERILRHYQRNPNQWIASGEIQRLVVAHTKDTPRSAVRRMQELHEAGELEVQYKKSHAYYRLVSPSLESLQAGNLKWFDEL